MRMQSRKLRMKRADLTVKTAHELRRLAAFIGVSVEGCLEKGELVDCIAASPQVEIISADHPDGTSPSAACAAPAETTLQLSQAQLEGMSAHEVKALMEKLQVNTAGCFEKSDMIQRLVLSGRISVDGSWQSFASSRNTVPAPAMAGQDARHNDSLPPLNSHDVPMAREDETAGNAAAASPSAPSAHTSLAGKSVGELKRLAAELGVSIEGCIEKSDIVERIRPRLV